MRQDYRRGLDKGCPSEKIIRIMVMRKLFQIAIAEKVCEHKVNPKNECAS
jgi:hypothetical protein